MSEFASITLNGSEVHMEKLVDEELIRLTVWSGGEMKAGPITLAEKELIDLLHAGLREGILTSSFIGELRKVIEI